MQDLRFLNEIDVYFFLVLDRFNMVCGQVEENEELGKCVEVEEDFEKMN